MYLMKKKFPSLLVSNRVQLSTSNLHENSECSFDERVLQHFPGINIYQVSLMFELYNKASAQKPWTWNNMKFTEAIPKGVFFNTHHGYIDLYNISTLIFLLSQKLKKNPFYPYCTGMPKFITLPRHVLFFFLFI